jgi:hypothetical protein
MITQEAIQQFQTPVYGRTQRNAETYRTVARRCSQQIERLVAEYLSTRNDQQLLREIRNDIDHYLRRYHEYCIRQRDGMGAHYREVGADEDTDFEHLIPAARVRDLLLDGIFTVNQALNAPTVTLSRSKHRALKQAGWGSHTPDMWLPFLRYTNVFEAQYETYDGTVIDPCSWSLNQHFDYFRHLDIATG